MPLTAVVSKYSGTKKPVEMRASPVKITSVDRQALVTSFTNSFSRKWYLIVSLFFEEKGKKEKKREKTGFLSQTCNSFFPPNKRIMAMPTPSHGRNVNTVLITLALDSVALTVLLNVVVVLTPSPVATLLPTPYKVGAMMMLKAARKSRVSVTKPINLTFDNVALKAFSPPL